MAKTLSWGWLFTGVMAALSVSTLGASGCAVDDTVVDALDPVSDASADASLVDAFTADSNPIDTGIDACASAPCDNGGTCAPSGSGFTCTCAAGFTGTTCATNIDDCKTADGGSPCQNGGTCVDGVAKYTCTCPAGFIGLQCETNVDDCASNPCAHGTCTDGVNMYTCSCATGYQGANCDSCATNYFSYPTCTFCSAATTCGGHGTCSATGTCTCAAGFAGPACQYSNATTCSGHGVAQNDGSCSCAAAYSGATCNACATNYYSYPTCTFCDPTLTCGGHGTCSATGTCSCSPNYTGANCGTFSGIYSGSAVMPSGNNAGDVAPQYGQVNGTAAFSTNSANNRITPGVATTLTKLTLAPSTGDVGNRTWTGTVMKNGAATGLTCQIGTNGNACTVTTNVALSATDMINIEVKQSANTGTSRTAKWSIDYTQP